MDGLYTRNTICDIIRHWAGINPDHPALIAKGREALSYADLCRQSDRIGDALANAGLEPGSRVAIVHSGGPEMATVLLGVMDEAVAVPLNPASTSDEYRNLLTKCRVNGIIIDSALDTPARAVAAALHLPILEVSPDDETIAGHVSLRPLSDERPLPPVSDQPDDLAMVLTTSGTTATGKIVPIRHRHMMARMASNAQLLGLTPEDRGLNLNRLFLHGGINNLCINLYTGGSAILMSGFDQEGFFDCLETLGPSWYIGSFTVNRAIRDALIKRRPPLKTDELRFARTSSGGIDPAVADDLEAMLGVPVIEAYATTETGRIAGNPQPPGRRKRGTVGPAINCEIAITNGDGQHLKDGLRGEVIVRGDNVFDGYENNPDANAAAFVDGWYRTGDEGVLDEDGYLTLTGRIKEMINRGGEKISPVEIDEAVMVHPHVREAAAFPIPHPTLGEIPGVALVMAPGGTATRQDISGFLKARLGAIKVPAAYFFVDEIPKGPTGKIQRNKLTDAFARSR